MKHGAPGRRSRNRNHNGNGGGRGGNQNRMQVFDSNGPDVRIRGTAHQICEKYLGLAKDSTASGDYILAQSYLQHAEHYQRQINEWQEAKNAKAEQQAKQQQQQQENNDAAKAKADDSDDLGLPKSITGDKKSAVKQDKKTLEDA
jgi:hypothetical protein